jgi:hypothetical protein
MNRLKKTSKHGMNGSVEGRGRVNRVRVNITEKAYRVGNGVRYLIHLVRKWVGCERLHALTLQGA